MLRKTLVLIGVMLCLSLAPIARGDDALLAALYGRGVHAFNRGDLRAAHADLTAAIQAGSQDPRAFYFRGLCYVRFGRQNEAAADFKKGAELEAGESSYVFPVDRSLERIQGSARQQVEQHRTLARITSHQRIEAARQARYQQRIEAEHEVLRRTAPTVLVPPSESAAPSPVDGAVDPFAEPVTAPAERGSPALPPQDTAAPETPPADAMPPAMPVEEPPATMPAEEPVVPGADPFSPLPAPPSSGTAPPAGDDPFGSPAPAPAVPTPTPPQTPTPTSAPTPAPVPPQTPPAAEQPAADDPFGSPVPATPPAVEAPPPAPTPPATPPAPTNEPGTPPTESAPPATAPGAPTEPATDPFGDPPMGN